VSSATAAALSGLAMAILPVVVPQTSMHRVLT